jgi:hypothetical protein
MGAATFADRNAECSRSDFHEEGITREGVMDDHFCLP